MMRAAFRREAAATLAAAARRGAPHQPAKGAQTGPSARHIHVVKAQETVGGIAKRYGVSPAEIVRWNQLADAGRIFPGDRLRVALAVPAGKEEGQGGFR
jgi:LysM repeat protein